MRICFFNRSYHPDVAATGQLLTELAEDLVRDHGCEVSVVVGPALVNGEGRPSTRRWVPGRVESRNGVRIFRASGTTFRPHRFVARATNYMSYFLFSCLASLRVPRADVVVGLTDPPIIGLAALLAARRSGARFVFLCQDVFPEVARLLDGFRNERLNRVLDRVNRLLIRRADRVIALGETMRERLIAEKGADPEKVRVIHNWADCTAIVPGAKTNSFSLAHHLAREFVVMHSGNIGVSQGLETLIDAAERLRGYPDIVVAIIGNGTKRDALADRARSRGLFNVRIFPYQAKDRLTDSFATADIFVISLRRGLAGYIVPSKLYRILAAGRPYVAAVEETSEIASITKKYECGLLAAAENAEDLAEKILTLYRDRGLAERLGANARLAALNFDRPQQVREHHDLFREVCRLGDPKVRVPLLKRPLDVALSGLGLLFSAPVWAVIALAIKLEDGGPVFYSQDRLGKAGRTFRSWKFRSMIADADEKFGPRQAADGDKRITRVGHLLRATALDELPQLLNIVGGDMSFVGPRALMPEEIEVGGDGCPIPLREIPRFDERHRVRPGLTGLAQIFAPRDIPRHKKFRYDVLYVSRQSLGLDLKLIALSIWITLRGQWETRGAKL